MLLLLRTGVMVDTPSYRGASENGGAEVLL